MFYNHGTHGKLTSQCASKIPGAANRCGNLKPQTSNLKLYSPAASRTPSSKQLKGLHHPRVTERQLRAESYQPPPRQTRFSPESAPVGSHCPRRIRSIPILTPFPHISTHIVEAKLIRLQPSDLMRFPSSVVTEPRDLIEIITPAVLISFTHRTTLSRELPFSFRRQTHT